MITKVELLNVKEKLKKSYSSKMNIVNLVVDELLKVDLDAVNQEKSIIKIKENIFELYLYSKINRPFIYIYIESFTVEVQIGHGVQFLQLTDLNNSNDVNNFAQILNDLFYSNFKEKLVYKGKSIVSAEYEVKLNDINHVSRYSVHFSFGLDDLFKKKRKEEQILTSWLN